MSKVVNHDVRRHEILSKARHLFADHGYDQVTFQQLADACGLSRTALYKYFTDKKELFDSALTEMTASIGANLRQTIVENPILPASVKLDLVLHQTIDLCLSNPALMRCIIEYLTAQRRHGESVEKRIRRHTVAFRRMVQTLLQEGIDRGEFANFKVSSAEDIIFSLMQSVAINIMFYDQPDRERLFRNSRNIIRALRIYSPYDENGRERDEGT